MHTIRLRTRIDIKIYTSKYAHTAAQTSIPGPTQHMETNLKWSTGPVTRPKVCIVLKTQAEIEMLLLYFYYVMYHRHRSKSFGGGTGQEQSRSTHTIIVEKKQVTHMQTPATGMHIWMYVRRPATSCFTHCRWRREQEKTHITKRSASSESTPHTDKTTPCNSLYTWGNPLYIINIMKELLLRPAIAPNNIRIKHQEKKRKNTFHANLLL